jgi:hypothetical protein
MLRARSEKTKCCVLWVLWRLILLPHDSVFSESLPHLLRYLRCLMLNPLPPLAPDRRRGTRKARERQRKKKGLKRRYYGTMSYALQAAKESSE